MAVIVTMLKSIHRFHMENVWMMLAKPLLALQSSYCNSFYVLQFEHSGCLNCAFYCMHLAANYVLLGKVFPLVSCFPIITRELVKKSDVCR